MAHGNQMQRMFAAILADQLVATLRDEAGATPVHLTGGALRDLALGRAAPDLDLIVAGDGEALGVALSKRLGLRLVRLGGSRYRSWRLAGGDFDIDLWELPGTTLEQDLWRRDLTINALALDLASGEVHDPTGGLADLAQRRLRATRPNVFTEDAVRCLRLARLALELPAFTIDPTTEEAARAASPRLAESPSERIRLELDRIFEAGSWRAVVTWLLRLELLPALLPASGAGMATALTASPEAVAALDRRPGGPTHASGPTALLAIRWAFLEALGRQPGHSGIGLLAEAADRGLLTRGVRRLAEQVLASGTTPPSSGPGLRLWLHGTGGAWRESLHLQQALATGTETSGEWQRAAREVTELSAAELCWILEPPRLLDGNRVRDVLHLADGPAVGAALSRLRQQQVLGAVRTEEEALDYLLTTK